MPISELQEIEDLWSNQYKNIFIKLYENADGNRFYGKMMSMDDNVDFQADTIAELIECGEKFLRRVSK